MGISVDFGKYIVGKLKTGEYTAIAFNYQVSHAHIAPLFETMHSAGLLYLNMSGELQVHGKSDSLNLGCDREHDVHWLRQCVGV